MQRYWEWLVGRVPPWIAPNLITIIGLATNVFTTLVLVYYCPTATEQVCAGAPGRREAVCLPWTLRSLPPTLKATSCTCPHLLLPACVCGARDGGLLLRPAKGLSRGRLRLRVAPV